MVIAESHRGQRLHASAPERLNWLVICCRLKCKRFYVSLKNMTVHLSPSFIASVHNPPHLETLLVEYVDHLSVREKHFCGPSGIFLPCSVGSLTADYHPFQTSTGIYAVCGVVGGRRVQTESSRYGLNL